jgi:hypothetical protein
VFHPQIQFVSETKFVEAVVRFPYEFLHMSKENFVKLNSLQRKFS